MSATVLQADALNIPLADASVDLIVTSPPYFALRSYQDGGEHYDGQIGSEESPQAFLEALWAAMAECWRVLKPSGSCWVNLGDKYAGSGGHNNSNLKQGYADRSCRSCGRAASTIKCRACGDTTLIIRTEETRAATRRNAPDRYNQTADVRAKSLMGLPWSFANGCIGAYPFLPGLAAPDDQCWILRAEIVWDKPNGLPESVTDRARRSHEQWFHFTKEGRYFAAVDEVREPHVRTERPWELEARHTQRSTNARTEGLNQIGDGKPVTFNPLGKLPGSVWSIPSEPLTVPEHIGVDHFAAFPTEWPRRIILGWSPSGICIECGEGRTTTTTTYTVDRPGIPGGSAIAGRHNQQSWGGHAIVTPTGYACACAEPTAPTTPAVILDPFGGTGTVAMVAKALGRQGISIDMSWDYCRLAGWRTNDAASLRSVGARTYGYSRKPPTEVSPDQVSMFEEFV